MQSWINRYSMTVSKTVGSGSNPGESVMHEWRNLEDVPDLESGAEMHVGSVSAPLSSFHYGRRKADIHRMSCDLHAGKDGFQAHGSSIRAKPAGAIMLR